MNGKLTIDLKDVLENCSPAIDNATDDLGDDTTSCFYSNSKPYSGVQLAKLTQNVTSNAKTISVQWFETYCQQYSYILSASESVETECILVYGMGMSLDGRNKECKEI